MLPPNCQTVMENIDHILVDMYTIYVHLVEVESGPDIRPECASQVAPRGRLCLVYS